MAIETRRACGYRKVGGLYLVGTGIAIGCDRLPFELGVCPTCHQGIKPSLGFTWVESTILGNNCTGKSDCHNANCEICFPDRTLGDAHGETIPVKYGLMWVGSRFYSTPQVFIDEAMKLGVSKRVGAIPKDIKPGDFVLLAHRKVPVPEIQLSTHRNPQGDTVETVAKTTPTPLKPAIFYGFHVTRIEKIITETQAKDAKEMEKLKKRGITPVIVPDADKDHEGTVYDKEEKEE